MTAPAPRLRNLRRVPVHVRAATVCAFLALGMVAGLGAQGPSRVIVRFDADGRCTVDLEGATLPRAAGSEAAWRCRLDGLPPKVPVDLLVMLPPGTVPSSTTFPRLDWRETPQGPTGAAALPAPPAFVSVALEGSPRATRSGWLDGLALGATALAVGWSLRFGRRP